MLQPLPFSRPASRSARAGIIADAIVFFEDQVEGGSYEPSEPPLNLPLRMPVWVYYIHYINSLLNLSLVQFALVHVPVATGLIPGPPLPITTVEPVFIGSLRTRAHDVSGNVFALDENTLMLTEFSFDGVAPGMYNYSAYM